MLPFFFAFLRLNIWGIDDVGAAAKVYIGTSGYSYEHWQGVFYPPGTRPADYLAYYSGFFNSVEMNVTFYRTPPENYFLGWYNRTPAHFAFTLKGSRYITHLKKLRVEPESIEYFFRRANLLREKVKVVLWQTPPAMHADLVLLRDFLIQLKQHNHVRHAFEFRHESWFQDGIYSLLDEFGATVCRADWPEFAIPAPAVGPFAYIRRHGVGDQLYGGCYSEETLQRDAGYVKTCVSAGRDVFAYFNNDIGGWAVKNARTLIDMISR